MFFCYHPLVPYLDSILFHPNMNDLQQIHCFLLMLSLFNLVYLFICMQDYSIFLDFYMCL